MLLPMVDRAAHAALRAAGFRSRHVPTAHGLVHAYDGPGQGSLPPVVVLHGIGSRAVHMARVLVALQRHASRVVAPDLPGHGRSAVPVEGLGGQTLRRGLREALDLLIDAPVVVVGNSLGGMAAIRYTLERSERVRGVLLVSPGGAPTDDLDAFLGQFRMPRRRDAHAFVDRIYAKRPWYAPLIAGDLRRNFRSGPMRALLDGITPEDLLGAHEIAEIAVPGRVLWGRHEKLLPPEQRAFFRAHLPAHVGFEEPAFGHCPHFDAPEALTAEIVRFARELA